MQQKGNLLDWNALTFGPYSTKEVLEAVADDEWQKLRKSLKGQSLRYKYDSLLSYLRSHQHNRVQMIQVTNYVHALRRGGLVPRMEHNG